MGRDDLHAGSTQSSRLLQVERVFDSHAAAQQQAGLRVQKILQNVDDPNEVVLLFEVADLQKEPGFVSSPAVSGARQQSGVVDTPDIYFLS